MAKYTPNFGLYMPEINDPNNVYTPGFSRNFEIMDTLLAGVTGAEFVDVYASGLADPGNTDDNVTKRFIADVEAAVWQGHRNAITAGKVADFTTLVGVSNFGNTFYQELTVEQNNPHGLSAEWILDYDDMDARTNTVHPVDGGTPYPQLNRGHNAIVRVLNKRNNESIPSGTLDRSEVIYGHSDTANAGGKTGGGGLDGNPRQGDLPVIDFSELYLDDIGGGTADTGATPLAIADKYRAHDLLGITENRIADIIANGVNSTLYNDTDDKRHLSGKDAYNLEGHRRNVGNMDEDPLYDATNWASSNHAGVNPHRVRPEDLYDKEYTTGNGSGVRGKAAIIREVNRTLTGDSSNPQTDTVFWDLIDKTNADGSGSQADIQDIPLRDHDDMQNISIVDPTSTDAITIRHITDAQAKAWKDHMDVVPATGENPHYTKASQLWNIDGTKGGDSGNPAGARSAILETLNANGDDDLLNWGEIDKSSSTLLHIETRNHDDLQNIYETTYMHPLHSSHSDKKKNKHVSIAEIYSLIQHTLINDNENAHRLKATDVISNLGLVEAYNQNFGGGAGSGEATMSIDLSALPHDNDIFFKISLNDAEGNVGLYFNDYYLGSAAGPNATTVDYEYIIPSRYVINGANIITVDWREAIYSGDDTGTWIETNVIQYTERHGGLALVDAINQLVDSVDSDLIQWDKLSKVGANITDIPTRIHADLQNIAVLDENSADTIQDKHLSNAQAKIWQDHTDIIGGTNPHNTEAYSLNGHNYGADGDFSGLTGADAITTEVNINGQLNAINWNKVSKTGSDLSELKVRNHDDLQNRYEVNVASTNTSRNKHLSDSQAKKWEDHADAKSSLAGRDQNNPHLLQADGLYTHRGDGTRGGNAIAHAINDYGSTGAIQWDKINFQTGSLGDGFSIDDIVNPNDRLHSSLGGIREVNRANSGASNADGHITDNQAYLWHTHVGGDGDSANTNNPHLVQAAQLTSNVGGTSNGGTAIVVEVNQPTTTQRFLHSRINWQDFSIDQIGTNSIGGDINPTNRAHDLLYFSANNTVNPADISTTNRGHVSNSQAKKWEDHADATGNTHSMVGTQLPLNDKTGTEILANDVENAIYEIDNFRNRPNTGPVSVSATTPDGTPDYFFDKASGTAWHLHVPVTDTYINSETAFAGKIASYITPTNGTHPTHGYTSYRFDFSVLPKDRQFYIVASESLGTVSINITTDLGVITDGKIVTILLAYVRTNAVGSPVEAYAFPTNRYGLGLIEKTFSRVILAEPYRRQSGMFLRDVVAVPDLTFYVTAGSVWRGLDLITPGQINSTDTDGLQLIYRDGSGDFVYSSRTQAVFDQYQNPAGNLSSLAVTEHVANMVYYDVIYDRLYIMLSERPVVDIDDFNSAGDEIFPSVLPDHIITNALLVGILLERMPDGGDPNPPEAHEVVYSAFDTVFTNTTTGGAITQHNVLPDLDTGTQYLHVTSVEKSKLSLIEDQANKTTDATVDSHIVNILNGNGVDSSVNTVTKIANKAKSNEDNKLSRISDDYTTGRLRIFKNNPTVGIADFSVTGNNNIVKSFIGHSSNATTPGTIGFWQVYKGDESGNNNAFEFWADNNATSGDYDRGQLVYRVTQDGLVKWQTELQMYEHIHVYQNLTNNNHLDVFPGLDPLENINIEQSTVNDIHSAYGVILGEGTSTEQGSILLRHGGPNFGTVMRARNEKFEIDTYGGLFINTDINRPESLTQPDPGTPQGLKYIDTGSDAIYTVYVGYDNVSPSNPAEPHPIILEPTRGKSLIKGGLHIGTGAYAMNDSYVLSINGGNVNFSSGTLDNIGTVTFDNGYELSDVSATEFFLNADGTSNTISFGYSGSKSIDLIVDNAGARFQTAAGVKVLDFNASTGSQIMYHQDVEKFRTHGDGILVTGNVVVTDGSTLLTEMDFVDHASGFKLRAVEDGVTRYIPMVTDIDTAYLRSDTSDIMNGILTMYGDNRKPLVLQSITNYGQIGIQFKGNSTQFGGIYGDHTNTNANGKEYSFHFETTEASLAVIIDGEGDYYVGTNKVWHAGDSLDASTLSSLTSTQFLRSDAIDTFTAQRLELSSNNNVHLMVNGTATTNQSKITIGEQGTYGIGFRWDAGTSLVMEGWASSSITGSANRPNLIKYDLTGTLGQEKTTFNTYTDFTKNTRVTSGTFAIGNITPAIDFAIGDSDTGIDWVSDGQLNLVANNVALVRMSSSHFNIINRPLRVSGSSMLHFEAIDGLGIKFWESDNYKIHMSSSANATNGGRLDLTSDYNMYFTMTGGTNRGFVFRNGISSASAVAQIDSQGDLYLHKGNVKLEFNESTSSLDFVFGN